MKPQLLDARARPIAVERSAYVAVCTLFECTYPSAEDVRAAHIAGGQKSIFEMESERINRLFDAPFSSQLFRQQFQHPSAAELHERILYLQLRYCPSCLRLGHHSPLFQNALLQCCPVHRDELQIGCPRCGKRIATTLNSLRIYPFHCAHCGVGFRTAKPLGEKVGELPSEPFSGVRDRLGLLETAGAMETSRGVLSWQYPSRELRESSPDNALVSAAVRHIDWRSPSHGTPSWKQRSLPLKDLGDDGSGYVAGQVVIDALLEIREMLRERGITTSVPADRPWVYLGRHALNATMKAAAIALCRTANAYSLLEFVQGDRRKPSFALQMFGPIPDTKQGAAVVAQHEVFGLFARCLGEAAATIYTDDVDWLHAPPPESFCPAWRLIRDGDGGGELQLRVLADESRLVALIERLGQRWLELSGAPQGYVEHPLPSAGNDRDSTLVAQRARHYVNRFVSRDFDNEPPPW